MINQGFWAFALFGVALFALLFVLSGIRFIPNDRVGIVERRFSSKGSVTKGFIALGGEAGFLPQLLRGGLHFLMPLQYRVGFPEFDGQFLYAAIDSIFLLR